MIYCFLDTAQSHTLRLLQGPPSSGAGCKKKKRKTISHMGRYRTYVTYGTDKG
jgi:hypothetical protein